MMIRLGDTASERVAFGLNWSRCNKSNNPRNRIIDPLGLGGCNKIHLCSCLGERLFNGWVFAVQSTHTSVYAQLGCSHSTVIKRVSARFTQRGSRPQTGAELERRTVLDRSKLFWCIL